MMHKILTVSVFPSHYMLVGPDHLLKLVTSALQFLGDVHQVFVPLICCLHFWLIMAIVQDLPLSKCLQVGSVVAVCWGSQELLPCQGLILPCVWLVLHVEPHLHNQFEGSILMDLKQTGVGLFNSVASNLAQFGKRKGMVCIHRRIYFFMYSITPWPPKMALEPYSPILHQTCP